MSADFKNDINSIIRQDRSLVFKEVDKETGKLKRVGLWKALSKIFDYFSGPKQSNLKTLYKDLFSHHKRTAQDLNHLKNDNLWRNKHPKAIKSIHKATQEFKEKVKQQQDNNKNIFKLRYQELDSFFIKRKKINALVSAIKKNLPKKYTNRLNEFEKFLEQQPNETIEILFNHAPKKIRDTFEGIIRQNDIDLNTACDEILNEILNQVINANILLEQYDKELQEKQLPKNLNNFFINTIKNSPPNQLIENLKDAKEKLYEALKIISQKEKTWGDYFINDEQASNIIKNFLEEAIISSTRHNVIQNVENALEEIKTKIAMSLAKKYTEELADKSSLSHEQLQSVQNGFLKFMLSKDVEQALKDNERYFKKQDLYYPQNGQEFIETFLQEVATERKKQYERIKNNTQLPKPTTTKVISHWWPMANVVIVPLTKSLGNNFLSFFTEISRKATVPNTQHVTDGIQSHNYTKEEILTKLKQGDDKLNRWIQNSTHGGNKEQGCLSNIKVENFWQNNIWHTCFHLPTGEVLQAKIPFDIGEIKDTNLSVKIFDQLKKFSNITREQQKNFTLELTDEEHKSLSPKLASMEKSKAKEALMDKIKEFAEKNECEYTKMWLSTFEREGEEKLYTLNQNFQFAKQNPNEENLTNLAKMGNVFATKDKDATTLSLIPPDISTPPKLVPSFQIQKTNLDKFEKEKIEAKLYLIDKNHQIHLDLELEETPKGNLSGRVSFKYESYKTQFNLIQRCYVTYQFIDRSGKTIERIKRYDKPLSTNADDEKIESTKQELINQVAAEAKLTAESNLLLLKAEALDFFSTS